MRDDDERYILRSAEAHRIEVGHLRRELAGARSSHEMQTRATLAFREEWLREKERADRLEAGSVPNG
jgi:hypothetical protein